MISIVFRVAFQGVTRLACVSLAVSLAIYVLLSISLSISLFPSVSDFLFLYPLRLTVLYTKVHSYVYKEPFSVNAKRWAPQQWHKCYVYKEQFSVNAKR